MSDDEHEDEPIVHAGDELDLRTFPPKEVPSLIPEFTDECEDVVGVRGVVDRSRSRCDSERMVASAKAPGESRVCQFSVQRDHVWLEAHVF